MSTVIKQEKEKGRTTFPKDCLTVIFIKEVGEDKKDSVDQKDSRQTLLVDN